MLSADPAGLSLVGIIIPSFHPSCCPQMMGDMADRKLLVTREGVEKPPRVTFREINPFALWVSLWRPW